MALFSVKHGCPGEDNRVIFVSTHLARNPENEQQNLIRIRQVCELMLELRKFASRHQCMHVPVVVAGDWNAESMQRLRFMALAMFSLQSIVDHAHPLLLGGMDVPTSKTSFTLRRRSRIDYLMYQETLLRPTARGPANADIAGVIPSEEHPSDHLPVWADFEIVPELQVCVCRSSIHICMYVYTYIHLQKHTHTHIYISTQILYWMHSLYVHCTQVARECVGTSGAY